MLLPPIVSTDYLSFLSSETNDDPKTATIPLQHQEAIDKFLMENEKTPVKIALKNPAPAGESTDASIPKASAVEKNDFFSETLAKIYLKQKKYEKALEIIRKLYLLYPEKNSYFADQIRFLEKLVINTKKTE
jgi:predicted Zn-dependent protease